MKTKSLVSPSLLSADFGNLQKDIELLNKSNADWIHLDIMDGVFVPNISFGFPVISQIKKIATKPLDVHLMIVQPERYIKEFKEAGADILSVHYETVTHLHRTIYSIKDEGMKAGVVLNPHTNVMLLEDIIRDVDIVLLLSADPGFNEQTFIENTYTKLDKLNELIVSKNANVLIEISGGVNTTNSKKLVKYGADILVAGDAIFKSEDPLKTIDELKG